jgi:hypothetical protein
VKTEAEDTTIHTIEPDLTGKLGSKPKEKAKLAFKNLGELWKAIYKVHGFLHKADRVKLENPYVDDSRNVEHSNHSILCAWVNCSGLGEIGGEAKRTFSFLQALFHSTVYLQSG